MSAFVLDASMALAWHFPDEATDHTRRVALLGAADPVLVPSHWFAEVANGVLVGERRSRTTAEERARFIERLDLLELQVDELEPRAMFDRILPLSRVHGLTVYDTLYLELAERTGMPLASLDRDLNAAARRIGVTLIEDVA